MSFLETEIAGQPECWQAARQVAVRDSSALPRRGERVAAIGCGSSWFIAQAYAALREEMGQGETDAFPASEMPLGRPYDRVVAISRSGTTTEVLHVLHQLPRSIPSTVLTAEAEAPIVDVAGDAVILDFANERSVVQSRFATTVLLLLRAHLGDDVDDAIADGRSALERSLGSELLRLEQVAFLGRGWTYGVAREAALKLKEAAGLWTEAYPAMEYRHGPISTAGPNRAAWIFGTPPRGLIEDIELAGSMVVQSELDPMAELILVQRLAVAVAGKRGLDPDNPRHLRRSVVLEAITKDGSAMPSPGS
jgi:fructoselysine-6-P-deglycase FrlB-like protein